LTNFLTLTRMRIQLTLRNKMFLFFSVIMPFGFFFLYAGVFARSVPRVVSFFLGPVIALTVMGSFWGLSAGLVLFREQGILRRFHVTPVSRVTCWPPVSWPISCSRYPRFSSNSSSPASFSCDSFRRPRLCVSAYRHRHRVLRVSGPRRRQRHQHHAGDSGHQSAHLAAFDLPFRSNDPPHYTSQVVRRVGLFLPLLIS